MNTETFFDPQVGTVLTIICSTVFGVMLLRLITWILDKIVEWTK